MLHVHAGAKESGDSHRASSEKLRDCESNLVRKRTLNITTKNALWHDLKKY